MANSSCILDTPWEMTSAGREIHKRLHHGFCIFIIRTVPFQSLLIHIQWIYQLTKVLPSPTSWMTTSNPLDLYLPLISSHIHPLSSDQSNSYCCGHENNTMYGSCVLVITSHMIAFAVLKKILLDQGHIFQRIFRITRISLLCYKRSMLSDYVGCNFRLRSWVQFSLLSPSCIFVWREVIASNWCMKSWIAQRL